MKHLASDIEELASKDVNNLLSEKSKKNNMKKCVINM